MPTGISCRIPKEATKPVYIIWIEPNNYSYFYKVEELSSIAQVDPLFVGGDGGVYRLNPIYRP